MNKFPHIIQTLPKHIFQKTTILKQEGGEILNPHSSQTVSIKDL